MLRGKVLGAIGAFNTLLGTLLGLFALGMAGLAWNYGPALGIILGIVLISGLGVLIARLRPRRPEPAQPSGGRNWKAFFTSRHWLVRIARMVLLFILLTSALAMIFENSLIFFPAKDGRYEVDFGYPKHYCAVTTSDGVRLDACFAPVENARGAVLWLHGNGGNITYAFDVIRELRKLGVSVFVVDYRGYGRSEGSPHGAGIYLDAEAAYAHLTKELKIPGRSVVILGESLGGAPAIRLASKVECAGLITQSTFTSIRAMAPVRLPFFPWVWPLVRTDMPNLDTIPAVRVPKLMIHSRGDESIPFWMGRALYDAAPEPKEFWEIDGAGHNSTFGDPDYYRRLGAFFNRVLPR